MEISDDDDETNNNKQKDKVEDNDEEFEREWKQTLLRRACISDWTAIGR